VCPLWRRAIFLQPAAVSYRSDYEPAHRDEEIMKACEWRRNTAGPAVTLAQATRFGGALVVAASSDPSTLNGAITTAAPAHTVADSIYNGLVQLDAQLHPVPDLAERWTISPDGRTYTFTSAGALWAGRARFARGVGAGLSGSGGEQTGRAGSLGNAPVHSRPRASV
jgi:hypothetical protein